MNRKLLSLLFYICGVAATYAQSPKMINVGDHSLEMIKAGSGPYTVIFESGFGTDYRVWGNVASEVMKNQTVVLYSRAGVGKSEANPKPQSLENAVADLSALIKNAGLKPPFILAGHSYGAFLIRAYAALHPEQVKGLVFVDPAHEKLMQELRKADPAKAQKDVELQNSFIPERFKKENELINAIFDKGVLPSFGTLPSVPAAVLTSVQKRSTPELFLHEPTGVEIWRKLQTSFFSQFNSGVHFVTPNSGHNIHREEPFLVVNAINQVIQLAEKEQQKKEFEASERQLSIALEEASRIQKSDPAKAEKLAFEGLKLSGFNERTINTIAYRLLNDPAWQIVALAVFKYNTVTYPKSANAFDSYGEALMKQGNIPLAKAQFLKAIELAEAASDQATLNNSRNNLKKIETEAN